MPLRRSNRPHKMSRISGSNRPDQTGRRVPSPRATTVASTEATVQRTVASGRFSMHRFGLVSLPFSHILAAVAPFVPTLEIRGCVLCASRFPKINKGSPRCPIYAQETMGCYTIFAPREMRGCRRAQITAFIAVSLNTMNL